MLNKNAILLACNIGCNNVVVEGDCKELIDAIKTGNIPSSIHNVVYDIYQLSKSIVGISFQWISREQNKATHSLAHEALHNHDFLFNQSVQLFFVREKMPY